jgi:hypothetical protein
MAFQGSVHGELMKMNNWVRLKLLIRVYTKEKIEFEDEEKGKL